MPLELLGPMVIVGIAAVVWLVSRTGGTASAMFASQMAADRAIRMQFPGIVPVAMEIGEEGRACIFRTGDGRIGAIRQIGRNAAGRLAAPDKAGLHADGNALRLDFHDTGFPPVTVKFASADQALDFKGGPHSARALTQKAVA
jgi:hypothetical protein